MTSSYKLDPYEEAIFGKWMQTYKSSALSRLVMLSIKDQPRYSDEILAHIELKVGNTWSVDEKSLHRTLRRLERLGLATHTLQPGQKTGAQRKFYSLTESGARLLAAMQSVHQLG